MKKGVIICCIFLSLFTGCKKKDTSPGNTGSFEGAFAYEKRVLLDMIDILNRFNNKVFIADTPEKVTEATEEFCDRLEVLKPEITFVTEKHPSWEYNPPGEMETLVANYSAAHRDFAKISFEIVKSNVEKYPDNEKLSLAYQRLKDLSAPQKKDGE